MRDLIFGHHLGKVTALRRPESLLVRLLEAPTANRAKRLDRLPLRRYVMIQDVLNLLPLIRLVLILGAGRAATSSLTRR